MNFVLQVLHTVPLAGAGDGPAHSPLAPRPSPLAPCPFLLPTAYCLLPAMATLTLGIIVFFAGCARYQIGNQTLYPQGIRTVYVPMFESDSFRRYLGEWLTEAVMKEIEAKTDYKVVSDPNADSVLSGRIIGETKRVLIYARTGDPRELQKELRVMVSWVDRRGRVLRESPPIPLPSELTDVTGTGNFVPEIGQSGATAQQEAIQQVARQIVGLMENPW
jgi:hypothetical protein